MSPEWTARVKGGGRLESGLPRVQWATIAPPCRSLLRGGEASGRGVGVNLLLKRFKTVFKLFKRCKLSSGRERGRGAGSGTEEDHLCAKKGRERSPRTFQSPGPTRPVVHRLRGPTPSPALGQGRAFGAARVRPEGWGGEGRQGNESGGRGLR